MDENLLWAAGAAEGAQESNPKSYCEHVWLHCQSNWVCYTWIMFLYNNIIQSVCCRCSRSSSNGDSRKRTALLTTAFTKPRFSQLSYKLCISHSGKRQLQLWTPCLRPDGILLWELPLYFSLLPVGKSANWSSSVFLNYEASHMEPFVRIILCRFDLLSRKFDANNG